MADKYATIVHLYTYNSFRLANYILINRVLSYSYYKQTYNMQLPGNVYRTNKLKYARCALRYCGNIWLSRPDRLSKLRGQISVNKLNERNTLHEQSG